MAAHQLLLASDDVFTNPAGIIALGGARDPLRMMYKERTRAGARTAILRAVARTRAAAIRTFREISDVCECVRCDAEVAAVLHVPRRTCVLPLPTPLPGAFSRDESSGQRAFFFLPPPTADGCA